jgi:hypothetical protein
LAAPHWSVIRWDCPDWSDLLPYLQAGFEKCPLENMTPLKGAEKSRLTDIPLFSQVTSKPRLRRFWAIIHITLKTSQFRETRAKKGYLTIAKFGDCCNLLWLTNKKSDIYKN